jgi:hypothetical protein
VVFPRRENLISSHSPNKSQNNSPKVIKLDEKKKGGEAKGFVGSPKGVSLHVFFPLLCTLIVCGGSLLLKGLIKFSHPSTN